MKLKLIEIGGFTGLQKSSEIEVTELPTNQSKALQNFFDGESSKEQEKTIKKSNHSYIWDFDGKRIDIQKDKLNSELEDLFFHMKSKLSYKKD